MPDDREPVAPDGSGTRRLDVAFERLADRAFRSLTGLDPVQASWLGLHGRNDGQVLDRTPEAHTEEMSVLRGLLREFEAFDLDRLAPVQVTDALLARGFLSARIALLEKRPPWRVMPQVYLQDLCTGFYTLIERDFAPTEVRGRALLSRIRAVPERLKRLRENVENPPVVFTETAVLCARGMAECLGGPIPDFVARVDDPALRRDCERARIAAGSALEDLREFLLGDLMNRSRGEYPVGKHLFNKLLREEHRIPFDSDELVILGEKVYHETLREVRASAARVRPGHNWSRLLVELKEDHPATGDLVPAYAEAVESARRFLATRDLITLPAEEDLRVVLTPPYARPLRPYAGFAPSGWFDETKVGQLWVTPAPAEGDAERQSLVLQGHARHAIPVRAVHEGIPGHHLQNVAARLCGRKLRALFTTPTSSEGWALYCEGMMDAQGFFDSEKQRLFRLRDQLWRACRVIVDVGLHTGKMSYTEAIGFLVRKAKLERPNAVSEVRRYCETPTQPMSYIAGKLLIEELRDDYMAWKGKGAGLRSFHDAFLGRGAIPIELARWEMGVPRRTEEKEILRLLTRNPRSSRVSRTPRPSNAAAAQGTRR